MITQEEITSAARPPRDTWIATATGSIRAPPVSFFFSSSTPVFSTSRTPAVFFVDTCALSFINVGLNITAMTGKLAEKLPLTMSSLINTIPDSLYPEEDIPTSMNIFTNTESINHYSQMNTGKNFIYFFLFSLKVVQGAMCAERQQLSRGLEHLFALWLLRTKADPRTEYFFGVRCNTLPTANIIHPLK